MPSSSALDESASPIHHRPEGLASSAPQTSRVTSAADLLPAISGGWTSAASAMPDQLQVPNCRLGIQIFKDAIGTAAGGGRRDAALRIVQIAEDDRLGRTHLLARRLDRAVGERLTEASRFDL